MLIIFVSSWQSMLTPSSVTTAYCISSMIKYYILARLSHSDSNSLLSFLSCHCSLLSERLNYWLLFYCYTCTIDWENAYLKRLRDSSGLPLHVHTLCLDSFNKKMWHCSAKNDNKLKKINFQCSVYAQRSVQFKTLRVRLTVSILGEDCIKSQYKQLHHSHGIP